MATYTFVPPYIEEAPIAWEPPMLRRYRWPRGISLYLDDGVFKETRWLHEEHYRDKTDGIHYFKGGYIYRGVSQETADALTNSGFGSGLTEEE